MSSQPQAAGDTTGFVAEQHLDSEVYTLAREIAIEEPARDPKGRYVPGELSSFKKMEYALATAARRLSRDGR